MRISLKDKLMRFHAWVESEPCSRVALQIRDSSNWLHQNSIHNRPIFLLHRGELLHYSWLESIQEHFHVKKQRTKVENKVHQSIMLLGHHTHLSFSEMIEKIKWSGNIMQNFRFYVLYHQKVEKKKRRLWLQIQVKMKRYPFAIKLLKKIFFMQLNILFSCIISWHPWQQACLWCIKLQISVYANSNGVDQRKLWGK